MFTPRHIKHSRLLLRHARKYLRYKHDKLSDPDRAQILFEMQNLRESLRSRDREKIHSAADTLDKTLHKLTPVTWESHWRENCEVILVAIVIAVGIRSYFLQPFKIPTASMQPTLYGITSKNFLVETNYQKPTGMAAVKDWFAGASYLSFKANHDGTFGGVSKLQEKPF